jgi:Skp family chaperone for outer membrane proteins
VTIADLAPLLGGGLATQLLGIIMGMALHRRFVMGAIGDADRAHEQALGIHRRLADDLGTEFAAYRERTAAEQTRLEERLATIVQRLEAQQRTTDKAHEQALDIHRRLNEDMRAELASYRERTAAEQTRLEERLATIVQRLEAQQRT